MHVWNKIYLTAVLTFFPAVSQDFGKSWVIKSFLIKCFSKNEPFSSIFLSQKTACFLLFTINLDHNEQKLTHFLQKVRKSR